MVSSAFYWSLTISQFWDVRRKDFWQMFIHHIATIALLSFSWVCNLHRIGTLVLLLHDCADIFVERLCDTSFLALIVVWISTRVGIYPFYIIWSTSVRAPELVPMFPAYYIFNSLLCLLLVLHIEKINHSGLTTTWNLDLVYPNCIGSYRQHTSHSLVN
ncbi:unnamed protein product [Leptidea sinapis]|uniref:TLC domain-containing protein n=1 Tax=Leptidea sinapis TaxID=189913 RepID=A0A5E4PV74_9NEOP|nr:unnamed protein product [Leptidea sinapis]